jgi:hypothetical protein
MDMQEQIVELLKQLNINTHHIGDMRKRIKEIDKELEHWVFFRRLGLWLAAAIGGFVVFAFDVIKFVLEHVKN